MRGELWQPCRCGEEPVCSECQHCDRHCTCEEAAAEAKFVRKFEAKNPGMLRRLSEHLEQGGMEHDGPVPE